MGRWYQPVQGYCVRTVPSRFNATDARIIRTHAEPFAYAVVSTGGNCCLFEEIKEEYDPNAILIDVGMHRQDKQDCSGEHPFEIYREAHDLLNEEEPHADPHHGIESLPEESEHGLANPSETPSAMNPGEEMTGETAQTAAVHQEEHGELSTSEEEEHAASGGESGGV